jgi:hypothetical protein
VVVAVYPTDGTALFARLRLCYLAVSNPVAKNDMCGSFFWIFAKPLLSGSIRTFLTGLR